MKRIFIANWKMQLLPGEAVILAKEMVKEFGVGVKDTEIVIAPTHDTIAQVGEALRGSKLILGSQDCFWKERGAYTGEVSPLGLKELGCKYVIVGHSERREKLGETDEVVAKKLRAVLKNGMAPVLCVGESQAERNVGETAKVLLRELNSALHGLKLGSGELVIAYEPIWAIGTGVAAGREDVRAEHKFIRGAIQKLLAGEDQKVRIIYGGSVNGGNMKSFLSLKDVSGALVGGGSLKAKEFIKIVTA